jgi:hypothetical protein
MNPEPEHRARACTEKALAGLGLTTALDHLQVGEMQRPELCVFVRGSATLSTPDLQDLIFAAFEAEYAEHETWPLLFLYTNEDRELASDRGSSYAVS